MNQPTISKLRVYPIKSLGFVETGEAEIGYHSLKSDRQFAMVDKDGRFINGKRNHKVNQLETVYDLQQGTVTFKEKANGNSEVFELRQDNNLLDEYLSSFFETPLHLLENQQGKFMDIPTQSSVTIVSKASLEYLQQNMDRHSLESMRLRFRTNIEISGVDAFWEEQLYHQPGIGMRIRVGDVDMIGISPRARCNVPPQSPDTGDMDYYFVKHMIAARKQHVATEQKILQYGKAHYFLCVNVYVPQSEIGKIIRLDDGIEILEPVTLG